MGRADGRGVLMDCHESLAGVLGSALDWPGLEHANRGMPAGISRWCRLCCEGAGGLPSCGHGVVTSGAKRDGTVGDTLRRAMHGGGSRDLGGTGGHGFTLTGGQRLWWRSWRWRCWVNDREKHSTPGCGCLATDGVVRRRRNTWPSAVDVEISGFDVVEGSVRIYVQSMFGEPGRGLSGAATMTRYLVAVVGWHRHGAWGCCVGGAGRDLRHVGVGGGESVWATRRDADLMVKAASSRVASGRSGATWPVLLRGWAYGLKGS